MMIFCPHCDLQVTGEHVDVAANTAQCDNCGMTSTLSDLIAASETFEAHAIDDHSYDDVDIEDAPIGCSIRRTEGAVEFIARIGTTGSAIGTSIAAIAWSALVGFFLLFPISAIIEHTQGEAALESVPLLGSIDGDPIDLPVAVAALIFLIPFVAVGAYLAMGAAAHIFGRCNVTVRNATVSARTCIGPFSRKVSFDADAVTNISDRVRPTSLTDRIAGFLSSVIRSRQDRGPIKWKGPRQMRCIHVDADETLRFGTVLPSERRFWMVAALRRTILK